MKCESEGETEIKLWKKITIIIIKTAKEYEDSNQEEDEGSERGAYKRQINGVEIT